MIRNLRRHPLYIVVLAIYFLAGPWADRTAQAQTFVTPRGEAQNVRFEQREDGVVHILYDLISTDPRAVFSVRLEASQDSGTTFGLQPQSTSGDTGPGVRPGTGKRIVWDSGKDVERVQIDRFRFRIVATGGPLAVEGPAPPTAPAEAPAQPTSAAAPPGTPSRAVWLLTPYVGAVLNASQSAGLIGGNLSWMSTGLFGFQADYSVTTDFFVTSLMANVVLAIPGGTRARPYVTGGAGFKRLSHDGFSTNHPTVNAGGGVDLYFTDLIGARGDVRYLTGFGDDGFNQLRATLGVTFRFGK